MADKTVHQYTTPLKIADFPKFCELLSERFHTSVEHYCEIDYFTIFISLVDHSGDAVVGEEKVVLAGLATQETFLNTAYKKKYSLENQQVSLPNTASLWKALREKQELDDNYMKAALEKYKAGGHGKKEYTIKRIRVNNLHNFLEKEDNDFRERIFNLMSLYFKPIENCAYLTIPLIQFGQIDGFVHIIYDGEDKKYNNIFTRSINFLIKTLSIQYESLLLSWAVKGLHLDKTKNITNPMLKELGLDKYYEKSEGFHDKRRELTKEHRKNAVTAIILDAYAHNIGAHSLPTITWWLLKRGERMQKNVPLPLDNPLSSFPMITDDKPFPLEMHHLLRFLNEKGEFWAGMSREETFGGTISSLYSALWDEFIQNLLVLGTIASTEGVYRLNLHLTIYKSIEKEEENHGFERKKTVESIEQADGTPLFLNGEFVSIDLKKARTTPVFNENIRDEDMENSEFVSSFLTKNTVLFDAFKSKLIDYKVFFPGNTIGKHAFFTLIESEIRNIKHYDKAEIEKMKENGLNLNISIEESFCRDKDPENPLNEDVEKALYKIGIWLNHPQKITATSLENRLVLLGEDIIDADFYPKLGGSYQDKICAAFLFNNSFISVQDIDTTKRHRMYYPWVKMGVSRYEKDDFHPQKSEFRDYEVSHRRLMTFPKSRSFFDANFNEYLSAGAEAGMGYYKKYIHLWKGKKILRLDHQMRQHIKDGWENPARFRLAVIDNDEAQLKPRQEGIIRVVQMPNNNENTDKQTSYNAWLKTWLKTPEKPCRIIFKEVFSKDNGESDDKIQGVLAFEDDEVRYFNQHTYTEKTTDKDTVDMHQINLVHNVGTDNQPHESTCRYRQHGVLMYHFLRHSKQKGLKHLANAEIEGDLAPELFEVLATKICIFENRLYNRITDTSPKLLPMLENQLMVKMCQEDKLTWESVRDSVGGFFKYHFLVVHLSFIEKFKEEKMSVSQFIKEEILRGPEPPPNNFIFVVTTGRGRTNWWRDLGMGTDYQHFTTFKTIEDLLEGVENATSRRDDFEIKYRLIKSLMGS